MNLPSIADIRESAVDWVQDKALDLGAGVKNAVSGVLSSFNKILPSVIPTATAAMAALSFRGSQGSFASLTQPITITARFLPIADENRGKIGRPLYTLSVLGNYSGFVLCEAATIEISGMVEEETAIEQFLNGGLYLE